MGTESTGFQDLPQGAPPLPAQTPAVFVHLTPRSVAEACLIPADGCEPTLDTDL